MNLYQCQEKAKDIGFDKAVFEAKFPSGTFNCTWRDAYFGMFTVDAPGMDDGFLMVKQIDKMFPQLECANLHVPDVAQRLA